MKKLFIIIGFMFFLFSCKKSTKVFDENDLLNELHPLDKPYDSTAKILQDTNYIFVLDMIEKYGPMSFRKENGKWFVYKYNDSFIYSGTRFKLFRVPLDDIYNKKNQVIEKYFYVSPFGKEKNSYLIDYTNTLNNVYSAESYYNSDTKKYDSYSITNEINIENFGFELNESDTISNIKGSAIAYNTTKNNIKNLKLKISVFDEFIDGELITEDIVIVKETLKKGQLKIIEIDYTPKNSFKSSGITPANIEILDFEKF